MKKIALVIILVVLLVPINIKAQDSIYPIVSVETMVNPYVWSNLVTGMSDDNSKNYTAIGQANTTAAYIRIDFYDDNNTKVESDYFSLSNFTIFSFRLVGNATSFNAIAENLGELPIKVYFDLYNQTLENLSGMIFLIHPEIQPTEYITVTEYVNITKYVNVTVTKEVPYEVGVPIPVLTNFQAIMIGFGGFCAMVVYLLHNTKFEKEKPVIKLTLDELLEEFRKGD